jgi:hypothetical protein
MPRLALNLLVLNGEAVVERCLRSVAGAIDELVVVDSGSDDRTREIVVGTAESMGLDHFYFERLSPYSNDFLADESASWDNGSRDRDRLGPFTGRRVLKDWAKARNLALANTTADYVLKLDADDELISPPQNLRKACDHLDLAPGKHFIFAPYEIYDEKGNPARLSLQSRLWRRGPHTRWIQPMHEYLRGMIEDACLQIAQGIRVRDWKDSPGAGVRIPHRNLKVMLWHHDNQPLLWTGHQDVIWLFTLANEAADVFPAWSRELLSSVLKRTDPANRAMIADCHHHRGRSHEAEGDSEAALRAYRQADEAGGKHLPSLLRIVGIHRARGDLEMEPGQEALAKLLRHAGSVPGDPLPFNVDLQPIIELREEQARKGKTS